MLGEVAVGMDRMMHKLEKVGELAEARRVQLCRAKIKMRESNLFKAPK